MGHGERPPPLDYAAPGKTTRGSREKDFSNTTWITPWKISTAAASRRSGCRFKTQDRPSALSAYPKMSEKNRTHRRKDLRRRFYEDLGEGRLTDLSGALRRMRKAVGLTQTEYARLAGVAPRG